MKNVLSIAALQTFLVTIISESCEVVIERSDGLPVTVCRKCIAFVKKYIGTEVPYRIFHTDVCSLSLSSLRSNKQSAL